jgi:lipid A 4'-phosphatase
MAGGMRRRAAFILLGATVLCVALFLLFPDLDLVVARRMLRADGHFLLFWIDPFIYVHVAVQYLVPAAVVFFIVAAIAYGRGRKIWGITAWQALYVIAVFLIGPGLLVNTVVKDHSHRPRPGQTMEFGGDSPYARPFDFTGACAENCSFVAGDPAAGFAFLAVAFLLPARRRKAGVAGAILLGSAIGLMRMLQGSHFFSDVIFCGLLVSATALTFHWAMFRADGSPRGHLGRRLSE